MRTEAIIRKFLNDEALLEGGGVAVRKVAAQLAEEGVSVFNSTVEDVQRITRHVLAVQREPSRN
jgi:hypothetical protein